MRGIHTLGWLVSSGRQIGALNHADDGNHKGSRPEGPSKKASMSNIAKKQGKMIRKGKEVRYGSVHIDLIGPTELVHNREAKGAAIDFLRTEIASSGCRDVQAAGSCRAISLLPCAGREHQGAS